MKTRIIEISKEVYNNALDHGGMIADEDMGKVFSLVEICGYGVYSTVVYEEQGKYYCSARMGESCD